MLNQTETRILKGELIRNTVNGDVYRVLYIADDYKSGYWIQVNSSKNIPRLADLQDVGMKLNTRVYETVIDSGIKEELTTISAARLTERDRIYTLIKDLVTIEPDIYEPKKRAAILEDMEKKTDVAATKIYNYLGRYWRDGMTPDALLPRYNKRGPKEIVYTKRPGRQKPEGQNGKILTDADKANFERAIREFYSTDTKPTLMATYDWMIAHMYTKPRFKGDSEPLQLSPDEKPSYRQFTYWHRQNKKQVEEQKKREGNRYELTSRGAVGRSDTFVKGPGMVAQIDATIADYYLVRENHRDEIVGRPVMFFIKDVKTRIIMGMYITLENTSWNCALMALKNTAENKVDFCKRYGVDITEEDWPCHHLPVSITADNGEMGDKGVEEIISKLGITIENTPPYRGDLKGIIENNFSMIDLRLRYIVPGHVDKDDGQRGAINRRQQACIDLKTFIQMVIRSVLYYNNFHYMTTYERSPDLIRNGIKAIPRDLWNYGMQFQSGTLRIVPQDELYRILLPKDTASVTERGICFRELYYTCELAEKELWFDKAKIAGRWRIAITYDPTCLDHIFFSTDEGRLITCNLLCKSNKFKGTSDEDMKQILEQDKIIQNGAIQAEEKAKNNLILTYEALVSRCQKEKKNCGKDEVGSVLSKHKLNAQREAEKLEQSGETAARKAQSKSSLTSETTETMDKHFETANDAIDNAINEALREAGILI